MSTYEFRFESRSALERAFSTVMSRESVVDCLVLASALRLRFRTHSEPDGKRLAAQIHLDGNIVESNATSPSERLGPWRESKPTRNWR